MHQVNTINESLYTQLSFIETNAKKRDLKIYYRANLYIQRSHGLILNLIFSNVKFQNEQDEKYTEKLARLHADVRARQRDAAHSS